MRRLLVLPLLLVSALAAGQAAKPPAKPPEEPPTFSDSAGAEYVMLPVLVTDKAGKFADGLRKEDFVLKVGETRIPVDTFDRDESAPVSFAFLVDTSGSMGVASKLENAKNAIRAIVRARQAGDDFALFAFSEGEVRMIADFSSDTTKLLRSLWDLEASGQTALFDAVAATPERMMKGRNNKRAILLFTDGVDNASTLTAEKMAELLQRVSVPVYPIGMKNASFDALSDQERRELSVDTLQMLASSSGGKLHLVAGDGDLRPLAAQISSEVRQQYLLGFAPSGKGDVKYRIVFVSVAKPGSWVVRTRRGYRGTAPGGE
ncbi:MAG TPA: VWA domain-containing protein [Thermoanaerobaculia bacterium]|nr:VWA domain-containing protein [Thermoanaerobaculia bacterium]